MQKTGPFDKLAAGKFGKYIIPGIVFQSVLIAGGYASDESGHSWKALR